MLVRHLGILLSLIGFSMPAFALELGPEQHGTMRFGASTLYHQNLQLGMALNYRFGLHDLLDRQVEYPQYTTFDLLGIEAQYFPDSNRVLVEDFTIVKIVRLPPMTQTWNQLSWSVSAGGKTVREGLCAYCGAGEVSGGIGLSVQPVEAVPVDLWLLAEGNVLGSPAFSGFFLKPSVGPRGGIRFRLGPELNGMVSGVYRYQFDATDDMVLEFETRWRWAFSRNWALDGRWIWRQDGWVLSAGLLLYD
ncbi:hypothetical protein K2X33_01740 [bacterium]|nr:hypothetical protein [bacterium]